MTSATDTTSSSVLIFDRNSDIANLPQHVIIVQVVGVQDEFFGIIATQ